MIELDFFSINIFSWVKKKDWTNKTFKRKVFLNVNVLCWANWDESCSDVSITFPLLIRWGRHRPPAHYWENIVEVISLALWFPPRTNSGFATAPTVTQVLGDSVHSTQRVGALFVCLVGIFTSSSTTSLYRGRAPRQSVWQFYLLPHMIQSWETMTSVSAGHIILTPIQPLGSGRPQRESNTGPPHQESHALPTELPRPPKWLSDVWFLMVSVFVQRAWLFACSNSIFDVIIVLN